MREILAGLGEPIRPPIIAPVRGPPLWEMPDVQPAERDSPGPPALADEFDQRIAW